MSERICAAKKWYETGRKKHVQEEEDPRESQVVNTKELI